jgi:hypothetical protein
MSTVSTLTVAGSPDAGGALSGGRLLGLVQRIMRTGMAYARCVSGIARERLTGTDLARLAPAGFSATATHYLVVEAVSWTAALRQRLRALADRRLLPIAAGLPQPDRAPRGRGAAWFLPAASPEAAADPWNDWRELAKPLRIGPGGVAMALQAIEKLSIRQVVTQICDKLKRAAAALGADADLVRIAALEAAALALCPGAEAAPKAAGEAEAKDGGKAKGASGTRAVGPPQDDEPEDNGPEDEAEDDPPPEPPDG